MAFLNYIEYALGKLLYRRRGYDAALFSRMPAFKDHPTPTIPLSSPDCGPSYSKLNRDYSMFGTGLIPTLVWPESENICEYIVICEDADAPFGGKPNVHGIYCLIPGSAMSLSPSDLEKVDTAAKDEIILLKSGFKVGKNRRNVVYIPCRPPLATARICTFSS